MLILKLTTLLSLLGSALLLFFLMGRQMRVAYAEGRAIFERIRSEEPLAGGASLLSLLGRMGIVFLSRLDRWEAENRFGLRDRLLEWNRQLYRAGIRSVISPRLWLSGMAAMSLAGGILFALGGILLDAGLAVTILIGAPTGACAAYFLSRFLLRGMGSSRIAWIEKRLPFAIEFLLLTLEASVSFPIAMREYCARAGDDPLADEFRMVLRAIEHGVPLQEALAQMNHRIDSASVTGFLLALTTGLETGQPIKEVLKRQADAVRQQRYKSAEETAKTAGVRALFPLFLVMLAVFLLLLAPMLIKMSRGGLF